MKKIEKSAEISGRKLTLATGHVAGQADGAVIATYGETVVLATIVAAPLRNDPGYFPLTVEYQERLYAGGIIKGSRWVKREGRPTDDEILTARLIDRSIRPLFPNGYKMDVQVIVTVLSVDLENSPAFVAGVAVSAAIASSSIPWNGPVGISQVGMINGKLVSNPTHSLMTESNLDLTVASTKEAILMIEAGGNEVSEKELLDAIIHSQKENIQIVKLIDSLVKAVGIKKEVFKFDKSSAALVKKVKDLAKDNLIDLAKKMSTKEAGYADFDAVKAAILDELSDEDKSQGAEVVEELFKSELRKMILSGKRPDGRKADQIRELSASVSVLPRTHGSGIFNRGNTQALTITTLGSSSLEQTLETATGEETKRYIHHYSMPPYSVGETGRMFPKRREIGHGALAEKALMPVIPSKEEFPYTMLVVTEILSSNGSTSMASVCGSTLSLMDAGVPIKSPVAGIAMGLLIESPTKYKVLTDIVGVEDGAGDMDFKVAGTKDGITAIQLDVKTLNLTAAILKDALAAAKKTRLEILKVITKAIDKPRKEVSEHAPKITKIKIPQEKIGEVIGPGGKIIKAIIAETGAEVNVDDDGTVSVSAVDADNVKKAVDRIEMLVKVPEPGEIYDGIVKRIQPFGAFVEILPGKDGLVYISDMSEGFVKDPNDLVSEGDKVQVRVKEIDKLGRLNLSMILDASKEKPRTPRGDREGGTNSGRDRNRQGGGYRPGGGGGGRFDSSRNSGSRGRTQSRSGGHSRGGQRDSGGRSGGPTFPASRLMSSSSKRFSR